MREFGAAAAFGKAETGYSSFVVPSNNPIDLYASGLVFDNPAPSPVNPDSMLFWNSLAGISPTPAINVGDHTFFNSAVSNTETTAGSGGFTAGSGNVQSQSFPGSHAKYKSMMPSRLPIPASFTYFTIPPGISPAALLDSPVFPSIKQINASPATAFLGGAPKREFTQLSAVAEGLELNAISTRHQGNIGSSCASENETVVTKLVSGIPERISLPATLLDTESTTGLVSAFRQRSSQVTNSVGSAAALNERVSDGFTAAQVFDNATHCFSDRSTIDGYKWKKYGQKQLKGTEFPRSYYKCTYPNCPVKKQVECSAEGEITEIMYKGEHNHPKPQGPGRSGRTGGQSFLLDNNSDTAGAVIKQEPDRFSADFSSSSLIGLSGTPELSFGSPSMEEVDNFEQVKSEDEGEDEQDSKRRRTENPPRILPNSPIRTIREPRVVVQTTSEVDILDDGYRWRKYGQKVVKGKVFPRSYYKCTNVGCGVRKHIERSSTDPTSVMTAYEGKHNHNVPSARGTVRKTSGTTMLPLCFPA